MTTGPLTHALDDEALHDGARIICRYHHPQREPCPCKRCVLLMMSLNEALSGVVFHDRDRVYASVENLRGIIEARKQRSK